MPDFFFVGVQVICNFAVVWLLKKVVKISLVSCLFDCISWLHKIIIAKKSNVATLLVEQRLKL